jgi:DEAD/DEAH box helicase domain-containing protein
MTVSDFVEDLKRDRTLRIDIAEHRYIPPVSPIYENLDIDGRLRAVLRGRGLEGFYSHQAEAIGMVRGADNVVAMTPAGSGKSLIYNIPVLESILEDPAARALYVFPLKGLEQDQVRNLDELMAGLGLAPGCAVYDGDTSAYRRRKIRDAIPNAVFTNPDMLHLAINAFHPKWEALFRNLKYVVIDEIHAYRGVFGSHVAQVLRRLRRIAGRWGANPRFIASSATIANPGQLSEALTGLSFRVVRRSGAPRAGTHFVFANPRESPYNAAVRLFVKSLRAGLRTIVFTKARKITELIYAWALERAPEFGGLISPYRAGFLPRERRQIEQRLFSGELLGVVSTSALELGVDIGGLDACILAGYPGSISSTWQRAGRVGRRGRDSVVVMVAIEDALDQYLMRHPEAFFGKSSEAAVIDPMNGHILKAHLQCAAKEAHLRQDDPVYDMEAARPALEELVREGKLKPGKKRDIWFPSASFPHRAVGIRTIGEPFAIYAEGAKIGELSGMRVFREAFPGAVYLHMGRHYIVTGMDPERRRITAERADVMYYTQARTREETEILEVAAEKGMSGAVIREGRIRISHQVTGYERKGLFDRQRISSHALRMPEYVFDTEGLWIEIDEQVMGDVESSGYDVGGTLHAFEHAAISSVPLFALCDKGDIGGVSYIRYPGTGRSAIFIYDGQEGGVGLTRRGFEVAGEWFRTTVGIIGECPCLGGCPSCVQDPQCGSGNEPLDKEGARHLGEMLLGERLPSEG